MSSEDSALPRTPPLRLKELLGLDESFEWLGFRGVAWLGLLWTSGRDSVKLVIAWVQGGALKLDETVPVQSPTLDRANVSYESETPVTILISDPTTSQRIIDAVSGLVDTTVLAITFLMVLLLIADILEDQLFRHVNLVRLRIAGSVAAIWFLFAVPSEVARAAWLSPDALHRAWFDPAATAGAVLVAAIITALSWIVIRTLRSGITLREENAHVI